ncbi:MAG: futalosine hydrolase [Flavipsychrobacter sp.]|nr:futalosine hydrolase [Flavipsychrobacter sp.]
MDVLIVTATEAETGLFRQHIQNNPVQGKKVDMLVTGVGMLATGYALTKHLQRHTYDLVIQAGVGGSFDRSIALGSVLFVTSDLYGDLGAEDHDNYIDIFELGLAEKNAHPHTEGRLVTPMHPIHDKIVLPYVNGLTINTVSGNERTIKLRAEKYGCAVESMEGAAFHYVCLHEGVTFAQVRSISNYVIPRDKSKWQMKDAIINLNNWLIDFIEKL